VALGFAFGLATYLFMSAVEVASHSRDSKTAVARGSLNDAAAVERELTAARNSRDRLPDPTPATAAMVEASRLAVAAVEKSRADECEKRGPNCRDREADERKARAELIDLEKRFAIFDRIAKLEERRDATGTTPEHVDGAAYRIGALLSAFGVDLGQNPTDTILRWWPILQAGIVELIAMLGPWLLMGKASRRREVSAPKATPNPAPISEPDPMPRATVRTPNDTPKAALKQRPAAVAKAAVSKTTATAANCRKAKETKAAAVTPVREWLDDRTAVRGGHDLKSGDAFADYEVFAQGRGQTPMTLTAFGLAMKAEGIEKIQTPSKRTYYRNLALASKPALVAVN
jgi:hypothetical protein